MSSDISLSEILHNQHFLRYASLLAIAMSPSWRDRHRTFPSVRVKLDDMSRLLRGGEAFDQKTFTDIWVLLFADLAMEDSHLQSYEDDARWFFETLYGYGNHAKVTFSMLMAVASTRQTYLSAEQVSEATGLSLTTIRRKASSGEIPGARKLGEKTWIFSALALQSVGIDVKVPPIEVVEVVKQPEDEQQDS